MINNKRKNRNGVRTCIPRCEHRFRITSMNKAKVVTLVAMVLNILLLGVLIFAVANVALRDFAPQGGAVPSSLATVPESGTPGMPAPGTDEGAALDSWIANMRNLADKHGVNALFLQELFPDKIVYYFNNSVVYADVDAGLPQHSYNWDYFTPATPAEGDWKHEISPYGEPMAYDDGAGQVGIFGIDVSRYQGEIDWEKMREAGVKYAFVRVGYRGYGNGEIKLDEMFESYMEGASAAGIPLGVYFFSQAITQEEALEEAEFVLSAIEGYNITWPVVFDMEEVTEPGARTEGLTPTLATDITIAFCERVRQAGYTPMIYGNVSWMLSMLEQHRLNDYDKWFAQYRPFPWYPYDFSIWQYSHVGALDGIAGEVDFNISFVDYGA